MTDVSAYTPQVADDLPAERPMIAVVDAGCLTFVPYQDLGTLPVHAR